MTTKYSGNSGPPHRWTPGGPWPLLPTRGSARPPTPPAPPQDSPMSPGTEPKPPACPAGRHQPGSMARRPGCHRCTWCPAGASCRPIATYTWCRWSCAHPPGSPRTRHTGAWASLCREDRGWEAESSPLWSPRGLNSRLRISYEPTLLHLNKYRKQNRWYTSYIPKLSF